MRATITFLILGVERLHVLRGLRRQLLQRRLQRLPFLRPLLLGPRRGLAERQGNVSAWRTGAAKGRRRTAARSSSSLSRMRCAASNSLHGARSAGRARAPRVARPRCTSCGPQSLCATSRARAGGLRARGPAPHAIPCAPARLSLASPSARRVASAWRTSTRLHASPIARHAVRTPAPGSALLARWR
jgi:hypothetical protein